MVTPDASPAEEPPRFGFPVGIGGTLALVGSGEFLDPMRPVDRELLDRAGGPRVVILPTASKPDGKGVPERWGQMGVDHFHALGAQAVTVPALTREDCERTEHVDAVRLANLIYFSGGKPDYLYQTLRGTALWKAVLDGLASGGVVAGCSAGAMILGSFMPDINAFPRLLRWGPAFGLVPGAVIIPHFNEIPSALVSLAVRLRPKGSTLIGVEGNTALVGSSAGWTVIGLGGVVVQRGRVRRRHTTGQPVELD
jgi:cyanophycinase